MTAKHQPTEQSRETVRAAAAIGLPQDQIALLLGGMDVKTLRLHYRTELDDGVAKANYKVGKRLFEKAVEEGDTTSLIWWTKTRMRWSEKKELEISEVSNMTTEELKAKARMLLDEE